MYAHPHRHRLSAVRAAWKRLHLVDRCLLLIMAVLMLQSLYTLFFPGWDSQLSGSIDVVVRTSAAAVFGYFLSANFAARDEESPQVPPASPVHRIEPAEAAISSSAGPVNQIGFVSGTQADTGEIQLQSDPVLPQQPGCRCAPQILVAACIGLFCLVTLILLRNMGVDDEALAKSSSLTATVSQFRDFVSGCVGFLIGCPSAQQSS